MSSTHNNIRLVRPEIERGPRFQEILENEQHFTAKSSVSFFELQGGVRYWREDLGDEEVLERLSGDANDTANGTPRLRIFFLSKVQTERREKRLKITSPLMKRLCESSGVSYTFTEAVFEPLTWSGNACFVRHEGGRPVKYEMFYQSTYGWDKLSQTWFAMDFAKRTSTYICINCPSWAIPRLIDAAVIDRPFVFDTALADVCLREWQAYLNRHRSQLIRYVGSLLPMLLLSHDRWCKSGIATEDNVQQEDVNVDIGRLDRTLALNDLHRLSADLYRMIEHLADFGGKMDFLLDAHAKFLASIQSQEDREVWLTETVKVDESIKFLSNGSRTCQHWASNYRERTSNRIHLVFHLSSQADNRINARIAHLTTLIAHETYRDSSSLITIAAVTMFFLPATFVAAIFSMTFFNFTPKTSPSSREAYTVSKMWWLYLVVTVPLTAIVFAIWDRWRKWRAASRAIPSAMDPNYDVERAVWGGETEGFELQEQAAGETTGSSSRPND